MKLVAIDGNSIVNRAFYGVRSLNATDGTPTNGVYGFLAILGRILGEENPDAVCVTFDLPAPTFRHELYGEYKAHRKGMPEELVVQMPILKEVLSAMNIKRYEVAGWEADDLLGTLAKKCEAENFECVIVTGDKDTLQLLSPLTRVKHIKTKGGKTETNDYTPEVFHDEYGFEPMLMIDLKALMGDSSDNIPGVAGVGEKTAMDLVQRFGRVTDIYEKLETLDIKETVKKKLKTDAEKAKLSYELAEIRTDAPLDFALSECLRKENDNDALYNLFTRLRFISFINKYNLKPPAMTSGGGRNAPQAPETTVVETAKQCAEFADKAKDAEFVSVRIDTEFFDSVAVALPASHDNTGDNCDTGKGKPVPCEGAVYSLTRSKTPEFEETLKTLLSSDVKKVGHDVKDIFRACLISNLETDGWVFDTALAAYLMSPTDSSYEISRISLDYCGYSTKSSSEESGQMSMIADDGNAIADEAFSLLLLKDVLEKKLADMELSKLYYEIELPLSKVLANMEHTGVLVNKEALVTFGKTLTQDLTSLEARIYEAAGETFNINSHKQLGTILFEKLMLPPPKRTKTGYSTNVEVLDKLKGKHLIITLIKNYRELSKLKSTYAEGLLKVITPDGRVHTHFQMTVTATGRLSSTEPNLQNIPVRRETGSELRKMFIAGEGNVLVDADYSQIELRLLSHIANDPVMIEAFKNGEDIHTVTASQVFGVPLKDVTPTHRFRAKAVNFGIVYGISPFSLAADIGVTPKEAKVYIESYLEKYSGVQAYMKDIIKNATERGFVSTLFSRRRYLPELKSSNFNTRSFGERVALNMPIQGTAADIMKIAMLNVSQRLCAEKLSAKLILQVHDELIVECPESEADSVCLLLREEMENAATLRVPLVAETKVGKSWHDAK
ncbi:MAG: DNA polymerase I [Oscillospiraceae bacterium]|nr:DNA polymerase I [Oscillospiraceae bacterium]MCL2279208.1 DNA polymerase I [Oscillospiraceae bacterium]